MAPFGCRPHMKSPFRSTCSLNMMFTCVCRTCTFSFVRWLHTPRRRFDFHTPGAIDPVECDDWWWSSSLWCVSCAASVLTSRSVSSSRDISLSLSPVALNRVRPSFSFLSHVCLLSTFRIDSSCTCVCVYVFNARTKLLFRRSFSLSLWFMHNYVCIFLGVVLMLHWRYTLQHWQPATTCSCFCVLGARLKYR